MIQILDSTLREGEQTPGVHFAPHIKLAIADKLDAMGISIIEAGHPTVSSSIRDSVEQLASRGLRATVGAHSRSLKQDVDLALECRVEFLGIFYCVSKERLQDVFKRSYIEAVHEIARIIAYAKERSPNLKIRYTPEDTVRSQFSNVCGAALEAVRAGADIISVADTTGYMVPGRRSMYDYICRLREYLDSHNVSATIAVHCHNDRGFALANALDAIRAGATIIDASVLGIGERAGIVDLAQLMFCIAEDQSLVSACKLKLQSLPELYELVSTHSGVTISANTPLVGVNAFTHCAGVHTHAASSNPMHYESVEPSMFGRSRTFALDHMSGVSSVQYALEQLQEDCSREFATHVLSQVKKVGESGRTVSLDELTHIVSWCRQNKNFLNGENNYGNAR